MKSRRSIAKIVAVLSLLGLGGLGVGLTRARAERLPEGVLVERLDVSRALQGELWGVVRQLADNWLDTPVTLLASDEAFERTRRELGAGVDIEATIRAIEAGGAGRYALARTVSRERAADVVGELRQQVDRSPMAPLRTSSGDELAGREGRVLAAGDAVRAILHALEAGDVVVELPSRSLPIPEVSTVSPAHAVYLHVLASQTTRYAESEEQWGRRQNIVVAAAAIDGQVIRAGGELSFNAVVGPRTIERGYRYAEELSNGRIVEGIGGGICQVAATLHAAALRAGFDIVEHHPHARGSRYIELGLDAAVGWPSQDLVVQNPFPFPVRVRAQTGGGALSVSLLGEAGAPDVSVSATIVERTPRGVERRLPTDERPDDPGVDGLVVRRERLITERGRTRREVQLLRYPAVPALVEGVP